VRAPGRRLTGFRAGLVALAALASLAGVEDARAQETHALVVVGIGGEDQYRERFHEWGGRIRASLVEKHGVRPERVVYLAERPQSDPAAIRGPSTKANVEAALREMAEAAGPEDRILVVLIGHGTAQGQDALFNLSGPDLSGAELDGLLGLFPTQQVALVNTTPSSGPFVEALSGTRRVVIAATRTGQERNQTWFGQFFAEALAGEGTDLDKDGAVSLLEAFEFTRREVERHYQEQNLLLTEHAVLDDDGDGTGSAELGDTSSDGALARGFRLGSPARAAARAAGADVDDPAMRALLAQKEELEVRIEGLRLRRGSMDPAAYDQELEALLVELALLNRRIAGGG
jgi:hypothetical protein